MQQLFIVICREYKEILKAAPRRVEAFGAEAEERLLLFKKINKCNVVQFRENVSKVSISSHFFLNINTEHPYI